MVSTVLGQAEHQVHLNSIRTSPYNQKTEEGWIGDSAFIEFVISNILERPEDIMFISNRDLLTPLCIKHCGSNELSIYDTLSNGRIIDFTLNQSPLMQQRMISFILKKIA